MKSQSAVSGSPVESCPSATSKRSLPQFSFDGDGGVVAIGVVSVFQQGCGLLEEVAVAREVLV